MKKQLLHFSLIMACTLLVNAGESDKRTDKSTSAVGFTENKGQVHDQFYTARPDVLFGGTDGALVFHLRNNGISYQLTRVDSWITAERDMCDETPLLTKYRRTPAQATIYRLDINWLNVDPAATVSRGEALPGYSNYYLTTCPDGVKGVKTYKDITYHNIYNGIDVKWYGHEGHLKYDYVVAPGANYKMILMEVKGAEEILLNADGQLVIKTPLGEIIEQAPVVIQGARTLPAKWVIEKGKGDNTSVLSFEIGNIDPAEALIIDPLVRVWGTYYGGTGEEYGGGAVNAPTGESFIGGETSSTTGTVIATSGGAQNVYSGGFSDAFLVKFNASGQRLWGTYFGGSGNDIGLTPAVDISGNVFICGSTNSGAGVMATSGSHQPNYGGNTDTYLAKFDANGNRLWSTYYGGVGTESSRACAVDKDGNVFMCGNSGSTSNIASGGAHQSFKGISITAFLVKFNAAGVRQWGTYYGGDSGAGVTSCAADSQGNAYLTGIVSSSGTTVATPGTHQQTWAGGNSGDCFLAKFNSSGVRQWGTLYGGPEYERPSGCFVDSAGNVFMPGSTASTGSISTPGSHQSVYGGGSTDGFLVKFNALGQRQWATYYGGPGPEGATGHFDKYGNILLSGSTGSGSGTAIATPGTYQSTYGGGSYDLFVAKFTPSGKRLWGTYYGGPGADNGGIAGLDNSGNLFLAGYTNSGSGIATPGSHQPTNGGGGLNDAFMVKFEYCSPPVPVNSTPAGNLVICEGETATLMASASGTLSWFASETGGSSLTTGATFVTPALTAGNHTYYVEATTCAPGEMRTTVTVTVNACTGITQLSQETDQVLIYPNPFSKKIMVGSTSEAMLTLRIYSASGALVHESQIKGETEIDLTHLSPGIYFVQHGATMKKIVRE